jgi:hypothetical protein
VRETERKTESEKKETARDREIEKQENIKK